MIPMMLSVVTREDWPVQHYDEVLRHLSQPEKAAVSLSYIVCATPRSGSTLLCEYLTRTGVAGLPDEWMLPGNEVLATRFGVTTPFHHPAYLADILTATRTPNGVVGIKVMWPEMEEFLSETRWEIGLGTDATRGLRALPNLHYVRMCRHNRLRQAVSLYLAVRTTRWHRMRSEVGAPDRWPVEALTAELADPAKRSDAMEQIAGHAAFIAQHEREWTRFFHDRGITPFDVVYEHLVADSTGLTLRVLAYLGIAAPKRFDFSRAWHLPMSDERNERLLDAYLQYCAEHDEGASFQSS
jgi:LPS sulfotransferase NodH